MKPFWKKLKLVCPMQYEELSASQKQAVIKLTEKEDRDKRLLKNWRINC